MEGHYLLIALLIAIVVALLYIIWRKKNCPKGEVFLAWQEHVYLTRIYISSALFNTTSSKGTSCETKASMESESALKALKKLGNI